MFWDDSQIARKLVVGLSISFQGSINTFSPNILRYFEIKSCGGSHSDAVQRYIARCRERTGCT
jgi:hypothetical protein